MSLSTQPAAQSTSGAPQSSAMEGDAPFDHIAAELARAQERRKGMQVVRPAGHEHVPWALAFSGGGIRSATYCLGVLQGLTLAEAPDQPVAGVGPDAAARRSLMRQFDYLSTVSGGGYIGSFFTSLFGRKRLNPQAQFDDKATADQAYKVFAEDPPGRLRSVDQFDPATPGKAPLAWLRENGRYMAASADEEFYAAGIAIRNWCAMHFVLGTILVLLYLVLAFAHLSVMCWSDYFGWRNYVRDYEVALFKSLMSGESALWWSPAWWLVFPMVLLWLLPSGVAYWMTHPPAGHDLRSPPMRFSKASQFALLLGALMLGMAWAGQQHLDEPWHDVARALAMMGLITLLGVVWHTLTYFHPTITAQRVALTRAMVNAMRCTLAVALFATVHTAAQTLYVKYGALFSWVGATAKSMVTSSVQDQSPFAVYAGSVVALMVWIVRYLAKSFDEKKREGWLSKIPVGALMSVAAFVLLFLVTLFWAQLVLWIQWRGDPPYLDLLTDPAAHAVVMQVLGLTLLLALAIAVSIGRFGGFLNLSTFQNFYSARLTRAYMGASNGTRFAPGAQPRWRSVAEPVPGDLMMLPQYYENRMAPMHIINICLNQNIDPAEQLVQRDRKGKPLAILPDGFTLDGVHYAMPEARDTNARGLSAALTVGEWIGVSGAAISTGMGREGGAGRSLLHGLANLRLGRWWESGAFQGFQSRTTQFMRQTFKTQMYLLDELFARFYGTRRPLQYLSDGGHFENTALYELLRPQRGVKLIVVCDCGCDPLYQFADLANVMRLARIDFGTEVEVDRKIATNATLGQVFGTPEQFQPGCSDVHAAHKCALLLNVYHTDASYRARRPDARVVVIKPRLIPEVCADLGQYQATHGAFPQEPTADQFYDEAQWESYRKLGLETAKLVFGVGIDGERDGFRQALWGVLLRH